MGYDRGAAMDALLDTSTVSEAAEYLIVTDGLARLRQPTADSQQIVSVVIFF